VDNILLSVTLGGYGAIKTKQAAKIARGGIPAPFVKGFSPNLFPKTFF
jgi:hypothetical protein